MNEEKVKAVLAAVLPNLDEEMSTYFVSIIIDQGCDDSAAFTDTLSPFIDSYGLLAESDKYSTAEEACEDLISLLRKSGLKTTSVVDGKLQLLEKSTTFSNLSKNLISASEQSAMDAIYGIDKIRSKRNEVIEVNEAGR